MKKLLSFSFAVILMFPFLSCAAAEEGKLNEALLTVNTQLQTDINAKACVLMDCNTGTLLKAKNENEKLYPASVTKIMTLLLVCEAIESGKLTKELVLTCSESAAEKGGSQIWLEPGETMTVDELLKAAVVYSANDASCLLGESIAGSEEAFCVLMNDRAQQLNMVNTHFDNCTGLDDDTQTHLTTALDIAIMSRELLKHDMIKEYTKIWTDTLRDGQTQLVNTNRLIRYYPGATGLKTGTTSKAGCCVSASAKRDGLELIAVVMGADNSKERFAGAKKLLDWGFANYEAVQLSPEGSYSENIKVLHGTQPQVSVSHGAVAEALVNKGAGGKIVKEAKLADELTAPVEKGQKLGEVVFKAGGDIIGVCPLTAGEGVEKMTLKNAVIRLFDSLKSA